MSESMYISVKTAESKFSFREAVMNNLAPDGSLFVPDQIPDSEALIYSDGGNFDLQKNAYQLLQPFIGNDLTAAQLKEVIEFTFQFPIPVKELGDSGIFVEELFHGPTFAFKDVGARFIAGCLKQWMKPGQHITILVATSGDTGGAVANAFYEMEGFRVIVLYPFGKISLFQEKQIAGLGKNIHALAIDGTFDDCQRLVKQAFADEEIRSAQTLTSANSINIARWIPQLMFYAIAWNFLEKTGREKTIVVPSGNYGNISAALLLHAMGYGFENIIAAHNENDTIPRWLSTHDYDPHLTVATYANAMDVSDPSNFVRFQYLQERIATDRTFRFAAQCVSDEEILKTIRDCWEKYHYLIDPHTATAFHILQEHKLKGVMMATAHPYKFKTIIEKALGYYPEKWILEEGVGELSSMRMPLDFATLKGFIMQP